MGKGSDLKVVISLKEYTELRKFRKEYLKIRNIFLEHLRDEKPFQWLKNIK